MIPFDLKNVFPSPESDAPDLSAIKVKIWTKRYPEGSKTKKKSQ